MSVASSRKRLKYAPLPFVPKKQEKPALVQPQSFLVPTTRAELWNLTKLLTGLHIPRIAVCPHHQAPFDAFADAFFARAPLSIWIASRGLAGKTTTLSALSAVEASVLNALVALLGGSREQSSRIHEATSRFWDKPAAQALLDGVPTQTHSKFKGGGKLTVLTASQKSTRGLHPSRLRIDEGDEVKLSLLDAALGQPMQQNGIQPQTVISSTHHYPDSTITELLRRADERGYPVYRWCFRETSSEDGWLTQDQIDLKKSMVTAQMWATEFELQEPALEGRAIDTEAIERMFSLLLIEEPGYEGIELESPVSSGSYAHGADWGKRRDFSVFVTLRTDCFPMRIVCYRKQRRKAWPLMIADFDEQRFRYGGPALHDSTGIGSVIDDYHGGGDIVGFSMTGLPRAKLFEDYILAIEHGKLSSYRIPSLYNAHKFVTVQDLYQGGHPPDEIVGCAMAYKAAKSVFPRTGIDEVYEDSPLSPSASMGLY